MNYSRKNTISQQKNDGQSYPLEITQSSGLDGHTVMVAMLDGTGMNALYFQEIIEG